MTLSEVENKIAELEQLRSKLEMKRTRKYLDSLNIKKGSLVAYISKSSIFGATLMEVKDNGAIILKKTDGTVVYVPSQDVHYTLPEGYLHTFRRWEPVYYLKNGYPRKGYYGVTPDIEGVKNDQLYKSVLQLPFKEEIPDWGENDLEIAFLLMITGAMKPTPEQVLYFRNRLFNK
jgi:hypothetical protein